MDIILSVDPVDLQDCGILVTGLFEDEKPLRGTVGLIDWRLNGRLSQLLREKKMSGQWQEVTLIPSCGRMTPTLILLLGLGKVNEYSTLRLRDLFPRLLDILKKLNASKICLSLPCDEGYNVDCGKSAEVLLEGLADCIDAGSFSEGDWVNRLELLFAVEVERFAQILSGIQTAQSILKGRLEMRILTPSERWLT